MGEQMSKFKQGSGQDALRRKLLCPKCPEERSHLRWNVWVGKEDRMICACTASEQETGSESRCPGNEKGSMDILDLDGSNSLENKNNGPCREPLKMYRVFQEYSPRLPYNQE